MNPWTQAIWMGTQRLLAASALLVLSPLLLSLVMAIRLESNGPALFRQQRRGLNDRPFDVLKFRTMSLGAEADTRLGTAANNPRITRLGAVLRRLKLDELPQLWNIARGEMAVVGPRPVPIALDDHLRQHLPGFAIRNSVRPGLSNLGQICVIDNEVDDRLIADWSLRFEAELHYLRHRGFRYDMVILTLTALFVLRRLIHKEETMYTPTTIFRHPTTGGTTDVIGTPIINLDYRGVIHQIADWIHQHQRRYVCITPVHSLIVAKRDPHHREALEGAGFCTADGMPVVWMQKLLGHGSAKRVYGPTLMLHALAEAERRGWRVVFYGGNEDRLTALVLNMQQRFPGLAVADAISPPYRELTPDEDDAMADRIRHARPDLVLVGLGCPKQERWMAKHSPRLPGVMLGVGAAFDFHAGAVRQAPGWIQRCGLEWAFRLAMEPRRLWKRYLSTNPAYLARCAAQLFRHRLIGRSYQTLPTTPKRPTLPAVAKEAA